MRFECVICGRGIDITTFYEFLTFIPKVCSKSCFKEFITLNRFEPVTRMIKLEKVIENNFRNDWERQFADTLNSISIPFEYESYLIDDGSKVIYIPDFYIPEYNLIFEVKGLFHTAYKTKFRYYATQYPNQFWIVNGELLRRLNGS